MGYDYQLSYYAFQAKKGRPTPDLKKRFFQMRQAEESPSKRDAARQYASGSRSQEPTPKSTERTNSSK